MSLSEEFIKDACAIDRVRALAELRQSTGTVGVRSTITEDFVVRAEDATYEARKPVVISVDACDATKDAIRQNAERVVLQAEVARLRAALDALTPEPIPEVSPVFAAVRRSGPPASLAQYARMGIDPLRD